jgi:hypothetical protein
MRKLALLATVLFFVGILAHAQDKNSGPLTWISSDVNPKTVFWIQGRFVPVDDPKYQGDAEVATILCSIREYECVELQGTSPFVHHEELWIQDFKPVSWNKSEIMATSRSLDGCTDETLKIHFAPASVTLINSPVLPMSESCKKANHAWDTLTGKKGSGLNAQTEQDMLVPTRGIMPFQDVNSNLTRPSAPSSAKNP